MIFRSFLPYSGLFFAVLAGVVNSATDNQHIRTAVDRFMQQHQQQLQQQYDQKTRIDQQILQLDSRLKLAACEAPLDTELSSQNHIGRITVKVSCPLGSRWTLYVPVNVDLFREVVVMRSPAARGAALQRSQLSLREINVSQLRGQYFLNPDQVIGMVAKRPISADEPVMYSQLEPPVMIKKGEAVYVTAKSGTLQIKTPGTALMDGREGEQISVRNNRSNRVIEARITGPGQVEVVM